MISTFKFEFENYSLWNKFIYTPVQQKFRLHSNLAWEKFVYLHSSTVNRYIAALSAAFSIAVSEWQWLKENPVVHENQATSLETRSTKQKTSKSERFPLENWTT